MSQKSSVPQAAKSVSKALMSDTESSISKIFGLFSSLTLYQPYLLGRRWRRVHGHFVCAKILEYNNAFGGVFLA